jgi:hypothetical protein
MTSGQSGPPAGWGPEQGGPPAGWGPEQGSPPPYGAPGQPYGPPPGQQWPAYPAPPSLPQPAYGGPVPTERPLAVRAGLGGFVGAIVLGVVSALVTFLNWNVLISDALSRLAAQDRMDPATVKASADLGLKVGVVAAILSVALYGLFVWFAWRGRNWARIVLWVLGGLGVLGGLVSLAGPASPVPFLTGLDLFRVLLELVGIVALALKPANEWFRYQGWLRATGQR